MQKSNLLVTKISPHPTILLFSTQLFFSLFLFVVLNLGPAKSILSGTAKPCLGHWSNYHQSDDQMDLESQDKKLSK